MASPVATGVSAATALVRQFAQTANVKIENAGVTKTRTQVLIEQIAAQDAAAARSGRSSVKLGSATISELIKMQAR